MNNPINDIPVYTPPSNSNLLDTFEAWLQGRINVCIDGHAGRIARLEIRNNEQAKQIESLNIHVDKDLEKINELNERLGKVEKSVDVSAECAEWCDDNLNDRVTDILRNDITFEVSVS